MTETRFWLIRHALVEENARAVLYGVMDVELCEATRKPRTSQIQTISRANDIGKFKAANEMVYGYDAWSAELAG